MYPSNQLACYLAATSKASRGAKPAAGLDILPVSHSVSNLFSSSLLQDRHYSRRSLVTIRGLPMPTEREKQAEKERVTRISGFRVGYHDFLAEVDLEALKRRNDRWEAEHRHQSLLDRKTEELIRIAAYVAMRNPPHHIQIHVHSAHKAGATPEEI